MKKSVLSLLVLMTAATTAAEDKLPDVESGQKGRPLEVTATTTVEGEEKTHEVGTTERELRIYPSNWGQAGIFRVRSGESLPEGALTFGIGGEFYSMAADISGGTTANTIAEMLFAGYVPTRNLTVGVQRRNSSTTFGSPQQLVSSLGDFNFSVSYSVPVSATFAVAPIGNILIASDFNSLSPSGRTVSAGLGVAATYSLYPAIGVPLLVHGNVLYHSPQVRSLAYSPAQAFYNFSRYNTVSLGLAAEYQLGDIIPFLEINQTVHAGSGLSYGNQPLFFSLGARFTPLSNKGLAVLLGTDIGVVRGPSRLFIAGVPFTPSYQVLGQISYTFGLDQTERKHYRTTTDVNVVDRKFVLKKNVNFKVASAELEPSSADLLDQIAQVIRDNHVRKLLIVGHTDSSHGESYNLKLSLDRANSVKRYLVGKGIPEESLMTQGYGKRRPKASNLTEEGRRLNRRVEFLIID